MKRVKKPPHINMRKKGMQPFPFLKEKKNDKKINRKTLDKKEKCKSELVVYPFHEKLFLEEESYSWIVRAMPIPPPPPPAVLLFAWVSLGSHSLPILDIDIALDTPPEAALGGLGDEKLSVGLAYLASLPKYSVRLLLLVSVEYVEEGETAINAFSDAVTVVGLNVLSGMLGVSSTSR